MVAKVRYNGVDLGMVEVDKRPHSGDTVKIDSEEGFTEIKATITHAYRITHKNNIDNADYLLLCE